jgi:hypothetical protein
LFANSVPLVQRTYATKLFHAEAMRKLAADYAGKLAAARS